MTSCKTCLRLYSLCKGCGPDDPGCQWHTDLDGTERVVPGPGGKPVRYPPPEMVRVRAAEGGPTVEVPKETWEEMVASPPISMGCKVAGPSPCSICRGDEPEPIKVTVKAPDPNMPTLYSSTFPGFFYPREHFSENLRRIVEDMQSGEGVDQAAVEQVMSELPKADPSKLTSEQWAEVCPTVGWEGKPAKKDEPLELPPPLSSEEVEALLQEGIKAAAEEHKRVAPMRARPSRMPLKSSMGPMTPVEVIGRYPEQALKVMQRLASKVPKPFKCSVCGADTPCRHVTVERRRITLCGSTRFKKAWMEWNARLTLQGRVVYSVAMWSHNVRVEPTEEQKRLLDEVHFAKINNSDEVFVLDVGGYIGESTRREIKYAEGLGKPVRYLSQEFPDWTEDDCTLTQAQEPSDDREAIWQGRLEEADRRYERLREEKLDALTKHREAMDEAERLYKSVVEALRFWDELGVRIRREGTEPDGPENLPNNWPWICQELKKGQRLAQRTLGGEKEDERR